MRTAETFFAFFADALIQFFAAFVATCAAAFIFYLSTIAAALAGAVADLFIAIATCAAGAGAAAIATDVANLIHGIHCYLILNCSEGQQEYIVFSAIFNVLIRKVSHSVPPSVDFFII